MPEDLYNYPTAIVHRSFKPPFSDNPIGTGPYTLAEFAVDDKCILKKAEGHTYWGGDVYLDEIHYVNYSAENQLTALAGGEVDAIYEFGVEQMPLAQSMGDAEIIAIRTAQCLTCKFRVDLEPFNDVRVRQAIAKSLDNDALKALIFPEGGDVGQNYHVAPIHPEYFDAAARWRATSRAPRRSSPRPARRTSRSRSTSATPTVRGIRRLPRPCATRRPRPGSPSTST